MIQYFYLLLFILNTNQEQALEIDQAVIDFKTRLQDLVKGKYQIRELKLKNNEKMNIYLQANNTGVVQITILQEKQNYFNYNQNSKTNAMLEFKGFQNNQIQKTIIDYYENEWELQKNIILELIYRNGNINVDGSTGKYYLYTVEDVRNYIQQKAQQLNRNLDFKVNVEQQHIKMQLQSEESMIMKLDGTIHQQINEDYQMFEATDYILKLNVSALKGDNQFEENFSIQMITTDQYQFNKEMERIMRFLELDKYSNNNKEHYINLKDFMKYYYPRILFQESQKNKIKNTICFKMNHELKHVIGEFRYHEHQQAKLGLYQLKIYDKETENPKEPIIDFIFRRMYISTLKELYKKYGLHKLFQYLYQEILSMYEEEYENILKWKINNENLTSETTSKSYFNNTQIHHLKCSAVDFSVETEDDNVELKFSSKDLDHDMIQSFDREVYDREMTRMFIQGILRAEVKIRGQKKLLFSFI